MTTFSLDNSGDARLALQEIYRDYGLAGIDDESLVNRLLPDLLPDSPREASLLRSAAGANVGHLLTDRISAQMPADAAVRDVTAMLTTRLAFDPTACLWVVSEYARAIGHPVDVQPVSGPPVVAPPVVAPPVIAQPPVAAQQPHVAAQQPVVAHPPVIAQQPPEFAHPPVAHQPPFVAHQPVVAPFPGRPADAEPTHMDRNNPSAYYMPGRAGPVFPPVGNDVSGSLGIPPRRNHVPLIVAIVVVLAIIGTVGIALALRDNSKCTGPTCIAGPGRSTTRSLQPSTEPSSPPSTPSGNPSIGGSSTLADFMPADLLIDEDCDSDGTPFLDHLSAYYSCTESDDSSMSGMSVWGYQFATKSAYQAGVAQFNTKVSFSPARAGTACPPPGSSSDGSVTWHRNDNADVALGHLECYYSGNHKNKDYAWTDDAEYTIIVAEATSTQTFAQLHTWWTHNNNNEAD